VPGKKQKPTADELMVVNDAAGEECRIAITRDHHLEELYTERTAATSNVGNIYKGRVTNVEPAIQAAFVDFGHGQSGFLHISDLHPKYFPGKQDRAERVGKRTSRRDRPPIQEALKRGQEVIVQVLKEGIGTKGPTLTTYLSIPGRLLVAMPGMERIGVSRKVEDEDVRREARKVLHSLDLPENVGFILRTAGIGRPKTEVKRDVAYLNRLWKAMDKRIRHQKAPCELYRESDLLLRTIRDVLRPTIKAIVVDTESAYDRVTNFLKVIAPRSAPDVFLYTKHIPIFHAFDVERQIDMIHSREVPLASGGSVVLDQTEAVVAIDVNSGKSRSARDSETNAYDTNCQAVDEICRQLRLRDLGGLVIIDLIDMYARRNRRLIEERMRENLKRDRAKTTVLRISDFGVLEMTRQRMRPSMRRSHFVTCPACHGRGEIRSPEQVSADAMRHLGYLLHYDRVARIELACASRVASVMLSSKRKELVHLEDRTGKDIHVRVSESIPVDRVDFYAYDDRNADVNLEHLPALRPPDLKELQSMQKQSAESEPPDAASTRDDSVTEQRERRKSTAPSRKRRGRRQRSESQTKDKSAPHNQSSKASRDGQATEHTDAPSTPKNTQDASQSQGQSPRQSGEKHEEHCPIRVHVLAKELGVPSKQIVNACQSVDDIEIKNHMSCVQPPEAERIRKWFVEDQPDEQDAGGASSKNDSSDQKNQQDKSPSRKGRRGSKARGRRGGRRQRRGKNKNTSNQQQTSDHPPGATDPPSEQPASTSATPSDSQSSQSESKQSEPSTNGQSSTDNADPPRKKKRSRRGRSRRSHTHNQPSNESPSPQHASQEAKSE